MGSKDGNLEADNGTYRITHRSSRTYADQECLRAHIETVRRFESVRAFLPLWSFSHTPNIHLVTRGEVHTRKSQALARQVGSELQFVHADHTFIPKLIANADCRRTPNPDRTWSYCQFICTGSSSLALALRQFQRFAGESDRELSDVNYSLNVDCQCSINSKAPKIHQSVGTSFHIQLSTHRKAARIRSRTSVISNCS